MCAFQTRDSHDSTRVSNAEYAWLKEPTYDAPHARAMICFAKSPCSRHDLRTLILQTLFARCSRRLSCLPFAYRYHTLCSLADFTSVILSHAILTHFSHLPFATLFSYAMNGVPIRRVLGNRILYCCQNNPIDKLISVTQISFARYGPHFSLETQAYHYLVHC